MEQSSSFVQHQPFQLSLLRSEFQLDKLPQHNGEEGTRAKGTKYVTIEIFCDEPVFLSSDKFLFIEKSDCIQKSGDTSQIRGNPTAGWEEAQNPTASSSHARLKDAYVGGLNGHSHRETCHYEGWIRRCGPFRVWNWEWRRCDKETGCS